MNQKNVSSEIEEVSINFIGFNILVLFIFTIWWYNVISAFSFGNYYLSGEKVMFEVVIYFIGSIGLPLLYTFYVLAHIDYNKIKKQSLYFKLIGLAWLPTVILLITICYNLATVDNRVYLE
jgi:hypothetical protein